MIRTDYRPGFKPVDTLGGDQLDRVHFYDIFIKQHSGRILEAPGVPGRTWAEALLDVFAKRERTGASAWDEEYTVLAHEEGR